MSNQQNLPSGTGTPGGSHFAMPNRPGGRIAGQEPSNMQELSNS